ncbi:MAG TPA: permease-like cell division protein FtsX [Usitatibacter sp.]|jgi:cell division transport system permease protein|nr:permease-like cell division protein FtsX [Usitatibacter sp.]
MSVWLRLHGHALGDALRRMAAQPLGAAFSVLVLAVAIALPVIAAVALRSAGALTSGVETDPHVNVYLTLEATDADVKRIESALRSNPQTTSVRFVSREDALAELKSSTHLAEVLASLDRNPLPHAFTVRVRADDGAKLAAAREAWAKLPAVDQVVADFEWSQRLRRWIRFGDRVMGVIALVLGAAVTFIVGHLIRLQVVSRRQEIEVSQLVGATASDVRRPFLYHGLLQGAAAGAVALALGWAATAWVGAELIALTPAYAAELKVVFLSLDGIWLVLGLCAFLGLAGAWWAVGRELRQFSPTGRNP